MKIKPNNKIKKFSSAGMPCSSVTFGKLQDGKEVSVPDEIGQGLIQMGLASKIKTKKVSKKEKK